MNVVFLGGGRITTAMIAGLRLAKAKYRLIAHDRNKSKLQSLRRRYGIVGEPELGKAVDSADLLVIAVRPDSVAGLLGTIGHLRRPKLFVSLAAGVPLRVLRKSLGPPARWARAMPSPVCRSGRGLTALTFSAAVSEEDRRRIHGFFSTFGQALEIPERQFDAFTVVYSCSHGYHAVAALAESAQAVGLDRKTALRASAHALADGIVAWREGKYSLDALLEEAATPGGIAATTTAAMDRAGYRRAVSRGVAAGLRKARANAR